jgi:hypothetical protein
MGMVPPTADLEEERPRPPRMIRTPTLDLREGHLSAEDLEEKLLVQELRRLNLSSIPTEETYREEPPAPVELPDAASVDDFLELDSSELVLGNIQQTKSAASAHAPVDTSENFDSIGLEEFEDEEIRPVVLLSPKPKASEQHKLDRDFMRDLERRLEKEAEKSSEKPPPEDPFTTDDNLIKER